MNRVWQGVRDRTLRPAGKRRSSASTADGTDAVIGARSWGLAQGLLLGRGGPPAVVSAAMGMGLLACPAGPDVVRFTLPLTISEEEIGEGVQIIRRALSTRVLLDS